MVTSRLANTVAAIATLIFTVGISQAAIVVTPQTTAGNTLPTTPAVATDLLQLELVSVSPVPGGTSLLTHPHNYNGTTGTATENSGANPATVHSTGNRDFFLDISTNTLGYDISEVAIYTGWGDFRAGQDHRVFYSLVGDASWVQFADVNQPHSNGTLRTGITDTEGVIASGVDAIRVTIDAGDFVYREVDVIGTATLAPIPEPSAFVLAAVGLIGLGCRRYRKRASHQNSGLKMSAMLIALSVCLLPAGMAQAVVYDIGDDLDVTFDSSMDTLTNTGSAPTWNDAAASGQLRILDGSDFTGVDFSGLGVTTWTTQPFVGTALTIWDGANLSGMTIDIDANNYFRRDSLVETDFSGATIDNTDTPNWNQPFLAADLTDANFEGATLNIGFRGSGAFRRESDTVTGSLVRTNFNNVIWSEPHSGGPGTFFNIGPGTTSFADAANAPTFLGADLSLITGASKTNMLANLGAFDGGTPIGAFYDDAMVANSGWTYAELDAAGWQYVAPVPEPSSAILLGLGLVGLVVRRRRVRS